MAIHELHPWEENPRRISPERLANLRRALVVASTHGNLKTAIQIDSKDLYLGVNAYIYAEPKPR